MKKLSDYSINNPTPNRYQRQRSTASVRERAQAMVLIAVIFVVLLAFVGVVTDFGSIYMTWTQLKRAVDAASVAAANNMKMSAPNLTEQERKTFMTEAARETLALNNVTDIAELVVLNCDDLDADPPIVPTDHILRRMCPTAQGMRKLAWVEARQDVPVYFLAILGVRSFPLVLNSIGEAAVLDLVLVFDTSESMGNETTGFAENDFDPAPCNAANSCLPLSDAKDAAKRLVARLYPGYDRVALVTFDYQATLVLPFTDNLGAVNATIDSGIQLHDDAPRSRFAWDAQRCPSCAGLFNPVFPEDRDGDGLDVDADNCTPYDYSIDNLYRYDINSWDINDPSRRDLDPLPCDEDYRFDVFNWDNDPGFDPDNPDDQHIFDDPSDPDVAELQSWYDSPDPTLRNAVYNRTTIVDTCIGCGIRMGSQELAETGRPGGVWVMVFLTDGVANLSDNPYNWQPIPAGGGLGIPSDLRVGYCTQNFWTAWCRDMGATPRFCIDETSGTCPPDTVFTSPISGNYSVTDYAYDRIDDAGLLYPTNVDEPIGADIVLYSIIFGTDADLPQGLPLMHYMADVGDDGARGGPCEGVTDVATQCGNYYYAANASILERVFEDIAARIFTKISR